MELSNDLISQFVKITNDSDKNQTERIVYGTIRESDGKTYVQIDGSTIFTPITSTTTAKAGDRVTVMIKDHTAIVTGNMTSPSATNDSVVEVDNKLHEKIVSDEGKFKELDAVNVNVADRLKAAEAEVGTIKADNIKINKTLEAQQGKFDTIDAAFVSVSGRLEANEAEIEKLEAVEGEFRELKSDYADFRNTTTESLKANEAEIEDLKANQITTDSLDAKYVNIDWSNIDVANISEFFSKSGIIGDLTVNDSTITGKLVGVTIHGDLIEGNTVKADKLVVKGSDGLYYKLNFEHGGFTNAEEVPTDSLHGSIITANSITAEKIKVTDLVAFGATIGGFHISDHAIYSGAKSSATNTTRGLYLDDQGQIAVGDTSNFLKYYKDQNGNYKLEIAASSIRLGTSNKTVEEIAEAAEQSTEKVNSLEERMNSGEFKGEDAVLLRIESSRGTVFKNNMVTTVLSAVIYQGSKRITDITALRGSFGNNAYLQWKWQRLDDETFGVISSSDARLGNNGFTFTLSADDVDTKVTFMCELIV